MTPRRTSPRPVVRLAVLVALAGATSAFVACSGDDGSGPAGDAGSDVAAGDAGDAGLDGATGDAGGDATAMDGGDGGFVPAAHPAAPELVDVGGAKITSPRVVPVYFASDPEAATIDAFASKLGASTYWHDAVSEYGIGAATASPSVVVAETPPTTLTDAEVEQWLAAHLADADAGVDAGPDAGFGGADESAIYTVFYPAGTTITFNGGGTSCESVFAYHSEVIVGSKHVTYAVVPRCSGGDAGTDEEQMTYAASHEIAEAVTDPGQVTGLAYGAMDHDHTIWTYFPGAENGDLCAVFDDYSLKPSDMGGLTVQRLWSNAAAKAGHDPCVPAVAGPYFNAVPVLDEMVDIAFTPGVKTRGVTVPLGQTKTIDVDLFSDGDTGGPWQVAVDDLASSFGDPAQLEVTLDKTSGKNGDVLHLSIKRLANGTLGGSSFELVSSLGGKRHTWYGFAAN